MKSATLKNQRAFTLIEIMVVISIIAVITSVVYASFGTAKAQSRDAVRAEDSVQMRTALTAYSLDHNGLMPAASTTASGCTETSTSPVVWTCSTADGVNGSLAPLVSGGYISSIPVDPLNSDGYTYYYSTGLSTSVDPATGALLAPDASFDYVSETQTTSPSSPVVLGINAGAADYSDYPGSGYPSGAGSAYEQSQTPPTPQVPNPPTNLGFNNITSSSITVNWTPPVNTYGLTITGYNVYSSTNGSTFTLTTSVSGTATSATVGGNFNTTYYFYVTAVTSAGESAPSVIGSAKTLSLHILIP